MCHPEQPEKEEREREGEREYDLHADEGNTFAEGDIYSGRLVKKLQLSKSQRQPPRDSVLVVVDFSQPVATTDPNNAAVSVRSLH